MGCQGKAKHIVVDQTGVVVGEGHGRSGMFGVTIDAIEFASRLGKK